jgi:hypothetical protein
MQFQLRHGKIYAASYSFAYKVEKSQNLYLYKFSTFGPGSATAKMRTILFGVIIEPIACDPANCRAHFFYFCWINSMLTSDVLVFFAHTVI